MAVDSESSSTIGEQIRWRGPKKPTVSITANPNPNIPSIIQSTRCKSTISSLLLSTFTHNSNSNNLENAQNSNTQIRNSGSDRKKSFKNSTLRGFGCTAQPEVTVPALIRSSAHWEARREKKKKKKKKKEETSQQEQLQGVLREDSSGFGFGSVGVQDLWCGPGIGGFGADCVVSTRPLSGRGKIDVNKVRQRERASYSSRQRVNIDQFASLDLDSAFEIPRFGLDIFEDRYYHHLRNRSPEGLAEIMMFQNGMLMGRRSSGLDRYRDLRLDVDNMTYEELLELGERIGYVSTGLGEDQIGQCVRRTKLSVLDELSSDSHTPLEVEGKCSICQEEYEAEDEVGKLECGHAYHLHCIKQWLSQKNACPVCKAEASYQ